LSFLENRSIMLYGEEKIGKSKFILEATKDHIYIPTENRYRRLGALIQKKFPTKGYIQHWDDFLQVKKDVMAYLKTAETKPKLLIIDTIDSLLRKVDHKLFQGITTIDRNFYNEVKKMVLMHIIPFIENLPITTCFVSHSTHKDIGGKVLQATPEVGSPAIKKIFKSICTDVWYAKQKADTRLLQVKATEEAQASFDLKYQPDLKGFPEIKTSYPLDWKIFEEEMNKVCLK